MDTLTQAREIGTLTMGQGIAALELHGIEAQDIDGQLWALEVSGNAAGVYSEWALVTLNAVELYEWLGY